MRECARTVTATAAAANEPYKRPSSTSVQSAERAFASDTFSRARSFARRATARVRVQKLVKLEVRFAVAALRWLWCVFHFGTAQSVRDPCPVRTRFATLLLVLSGACVCVFLVHAVFSAFISIS